MSAMRPGTICLPNVAVESAEHGPGCVPVTFSRVWNRCQACGSIEPAGRSPCRDPTNFQRTHKGPGCPLSRLGDMLAFETSMPIPVACACGRTYQLKEELAGTEVRCPDCRRAMRVPGGLPDTPLPAGMDPAFHRNVFLLRQQHFAINEKYFVCDEAGREIFFVQRPARILRSLAAVALGLAAAGGLTALIWLAVGMIPEHLHHVPLVACALLFVPVWFFVTLSVYPKRDVTFYRDASGAQRLLEVLQDQVFAPITQTFTVRLPDATVLALFSKNIIYDFFRKRWTIHRPDGALWATAREDSILLSLLRRLLGSFYGLLRTNFVIFRADSEDSIGEFNRKFTILDRYVLDMTADRVGELDRRVALALGVMLDTGERR